jgi:hypothetical protein
MQSLSRLKSRIADLLEARKAQAPLPRAVLILPVNNRIDYPEGPWPRVARFPTHDLVSYRLEDGQPNASVIEAMVQS